MKTIFILFLLFFITSCSNSQVGGPLPMLVVNWEDGQGDGILFPFDFGIELLNQNQTDVIARFGDDQWILFETAVSMLKAVGLDIGTLEDRFSGEKLTVEIAQEILLRVNPAGTGIQITDDNKDRIISYALWVDIYLRILDELNLSNEIERLNIIPFSQNGNTLLTNLGEFMVNNINFLQFIDMEVGVKQINSQIILIKGLTNQTPIIRNAFILNTDIIGVTVLSGGTERNYAYAERVEHLSLTTTIASIKINNQNVVAVSPAENVIRGTVERINGRYVELKEWGSVPLCPAFQVYGLHLDIGRILQKDPSDLLVGADMADFFIKEGRIVAAVITREISPIYIRVVLNNSGMNGLIHESVTITSDGDFIVKGGSQTEIIRSGEHFTVNNNTNNDFWGGQRFYISPVDPLNRLEIVGIRRNWQGGANPRYRGTIEISSHENGFVIVNELLLEEYLYAVVPSEMPSSHGLEAAKVQAVTARSFAYHQFYENRFRNFGAHVDDSVISQVYNNIPENELSIEAVRATSGQVLTFDGEVILANYFSTSSGFSANFGEVWAVGSGFPTPSPVYLRSMPQFLTSEFSSGDLSQERYANAFFRNWEVPGFDRNFAWFRWKVHLTNEDLTRSINANLLQRQTANPSMIHVLDENGNWAQNRVSSIGSLINIEITRRGQGGNLMEIIINGTDAVVRVRTEFNIRTLLNPGNVTVTRHDGSTVSGLSLLPSAFISLEKELLENGRLSAVTIYGGGNGHGVGMSQNGARALIELGYTYVDVLRHYYPDTVVKTIAELR